MFHIKAVARAQGNGIGSESNTVLLCFLNDGRGELDLKLHLRVNTRLSIAAVLHKAQVIWASCRSEHWVITKSMRCKVSQSVWSEAASMRSVFIWQVKPRVDDSKIMGCTKVLYSLIDFINTVIISFSMWSLPTLALNSPRRMILSLHGTAWWMQLWVS